jgi:hypothetical protein
MLYDRCTPCCASPQPDVPDPVSDAACVARRSRVHRLARSGLATGSRTLGTARREPRTESGSALRGERRAAMRAPRNARARVSGAQSLPRRRAPGSAAGDVLRSAQGRLESWLTEARPVAVQPPEAVRAPMSVRALSRWRRVRAVLGAANRLAIEHRLHLVRAFAPPRRSGALDHDCSAIRLSGSWSSTPRPRPLKAS